MLLRHETSEFKFEDSIQSEIVPLELVISDSSYVLGFIDLVTGFITHEYLLLVHLTCWSY